MRSLFLRNTGATWKSDLRPLKRFSIWGLILVRLEDRFGGEGGIRDQRKDPIDGLGPSELFRVLLDHELRNVFDGAMVGRRGRGFAAGGLCEGFLHAVAHGHREPQEPPDTSR